MEGQNPFPRFLAWDDQRPFISKFGIPGLLLFVAVVMLRSATRPAAMALAVLIGLWAITEFFIVGLVKPEEKCMYYRRFLKWERVEYEDIRKCGHSIFVPLLYLKLKRHRFPFGNLYFVSYNPVKWIWQQPKADRDTLIYIRERAGRTVSSPPPVGRENEHFVDVSGLTESEWKAKAIRAAFGFATGLGIQFLNLIIHSKPLFVVRWPFDLIIGLILTAGILLPYVRQFDSWFAVALGAMIGGLVIRLL